MRSRAFRLLRSCLPVSMKVLSLVLAVLLSTCVSSFSLERETLPQTSDAPSEAPVQETVALFKELSETLIKQTGTAISPVIGLSSLAVTGDPSVEKYKPWIWFVLVLLGAVLLKDVGGTFVPGVLKKPLDAVEFFQNQGLGALCAGLLVPDLHEKLYSVMERHVPVAEWAGGGGGQYIFAATGSEGLLHILTLPLSIVVFASVWLLSNAINALILLSPFSLVEACLKSIKVAGLALLAGLTAIHPYAGAAFSIIIVVVALCLAGKAFRLYRFSVIFAWDILTRKHKRFQPHPEHVMVFLDQELAEVPSRTYGRLSPDLAPGQWRFTYRPWLILPESVVVIPLDPRPKLGRGIVHATVEVSEDDGDLDTYFHLLPRYRGHETTVGQCLELEVVDIGLRRGFTLACRWIKSAFRKKRSVAAV